MSASPKQPSLKPQDLLLALKLCVSPPGATYAVLAEELSVSVSEVHAAARRAAISLLLNQEGSSYVPNRPAIREFLVHGTKYAFPLIQGGLQRGLPTGASAPPLSQHFGQSDGFPLVWPDTEGQVRGIAVTPLYPSVPYACRRDEKLYKLLSVVEALRGGTAREREAALNALEKVIK